MRFRVYHGGTGKVRKVVAVKHTKAESIVLHLDVTKLWAADLVHADTEGLEFHWRDILSEERWNRVKDEWTDVTILSGETLKTLVTEWPIEYDPVEEEALPVETVKVKMEGIPVTLEFDQETIEEIFTEWKLSAVDWDEFTDTLAHVDEDYTDIMNDFRDQIVKCDHAVVEDFEDIVYWLDKQFDSLSKELERRVDKAIASWEK